MPDSHSEAKETLLHLAVSHKGGEGVACRRGGSPQLKLWRCFAFFVLLLSVLGELLPSTALFFIFSNKCLQQY